MIAQIERAGLQDQIRVDSAGTASYHIGKSADSRSIAAARKRSIELPSRARQFQSEDFDRFDYVLCMDESNLQELQAMADEEQREKLFLLRDFDPDSPKGSSVPDPYYGGHSGFEIVLDLCTAACQGLLNEIVERHGLTAIRPG